MCCVVKAMPGRFTSGKYLVSITKKAWWARGPVWTDVEYLATNGFRYPDRPARSYLLYGLSYPGQMRNN